MITSNLIQGWNDAYQACKQGKPHHNKQVIGMPILRKKDLKTIVYVLSQSQLRLPILRGVSANTEFIIILLNLLLDFCFPVATAAGDKYKSSPFTVFQIALTGSKLSSFERGLEFKVSNNLLMEREAKREKREKVISS